MTIWFISDTHFSHGNIIKYCKRPFADPNQLDANGKMLVTKENIQKMNETMISNWNNRVSDDDTVYHLGDFSFGPQEPFVSRLKGKKHLILGNHDNQKDIAINYWESISHYKEINVNKQWIILCHYKFSVYNGSHKGYWHLWGHSHGSYPDDPNQLSFDVGVDCWDFSPISFDEVKKVMSKKTWKPMDHHR